MTVPSPRPAGADDLASLDELMSDAFKKPLLQWFPHLFSPENLPDCRVIEEDGKVVSHVGMVVDRISLLGCGLTAGCVGAVSTREAYRGRGY